MKKSILCALALVLLCAGAVRATEAWRDSNFAYRVKVTMDAPPNTDASDTDTENFPVLLYLDGTSEARGQIPSANITEDKWVVYDGDGNKVAWEKEAYTDDGGSGYAVITLWVGQFDLYSSPSGDQNCLWLYYDNSATSANTATDVWSNGYVGVWHMADASGGRLTARAMATTSPKVAPPHIRRRARSATACCSMMRRANTWKRASR